ncbi:MAG TPA: META domain-containing protein [Paracoccaceae bacterium]|nr:META domain-containing protein [Paracoccaceae bacterium]HMO71958.1 META domain-containing protein [Paracoccaceae bacterium]
MIRVALAALLLSLAACTVEAPPPEPAVPEGPGTWRLVGLNGTPPGGAVTLRFDDGGRFAGQGPCNRYFGTYTGSAPAFRAGPVGATQMACDRLEEEGRYFAALSAVTRIERTGAMMVLTGPGVRLDYAMPVN